MTTTSFYATGKRKTSIAKVYLAAGNGKVSINNQPMEQYFTSEFQRQDILMPLAITGTMGNYDVKVMALGGGKSGQAGAMRLGIARALLSINEEFRPSLRTAGLLTRDPRMVERKKYGRRKARARFQFSKR